MQFRDGNRIDLHVESISHAKENILNDKLCKILLDKDNLLPAIPESTDEDYRVKEPSKEQYLCTCNEFWWCLNNVAKGLWREEITFVHDIFYGWIHPQLIKMLNWKIGYETDFKVSTGKSSKYMSKWLSKDLWNRFLKTYINGNIADSWDSIFLMCELFDEVAHEVAEYSGFHYNEEEAAASLSFLKHVHQLPKDAKEVY